MPPTGDAVTVEDVEFPKDDAHLELTEPLRERVGDEEPMRFIAGVLHAEELNWVGASVGGRIVVEEVTYRLVKLAFYRVLRWLRVQMTCLWTNWSV